MANRHTTLVSLFEDVADAIRSKNNTLADIVADNFDTSISALNTGIDATASASDIMSGKTAVVNNAVVTGTLGTGTLSATDSSISGGSFTPSLAYNSTNDNYDYSGSKNATGTAYAKVTTSGYVTSSQNTSKSLSATVSATGTVAKTKIKSTNSGTTTVTPVISKNAISISGVTDAANGSATTTAPSSGVYVAVQSAKNTGTLTSTPALTSATAQYTDGTNYSATTASSTVGANASAVTYVPIKTGSATTPAKTITKNPTISWDSTNNKIKATYSGSQSITPTVSAGWVASGTAGTVSTTGTTSIDPESLDSDLTAANIKDGVTIFDVTGTFSDSSTVSSGQSAAAAGNILTGKSAFLDGAELKGSMTNNGAVSQTITSQGGSYTIPAGYHNGSGKVTASIAASTLDNTIISGEAVEESTGDYGWKTTVAVPAGYHNAQTLEKTFSEIFPAPETPATAAQMLSGYQAYNKSGVLMTGTMANNGATGSTISTQGGTYTIPAGYTSGGTVTASINNGVITSGAGTATISDPVYNSTDGDFDLTASGTVAAPTVGTAGYVSSSAGTKNTNTISGSKTLDKVGTGVNITGTTTKAPTLARTAKPSADTWVDAASGAATTTKPTSGPYVQIDAAANTGTLTATPKVTSAGYGTTSQYGATADTATVGAAKATTAYVPITTTSASVSGKTVSYGTGWITGGSKSVADGSVSVSASGTATAPTIAKTSTTASGATNVGVATSTTAPTSGYFVSNQATAPATTITVTPTHTDGYITDVTNNGGTMAAKTGSVYYTTLATGALSVSGSVTNVNGSGSINPGTNTISKNSATNVSIGTVTTTKPSSGYYVAVDAATAQNTGSISVSGTNSTGASATVSTAGYVTTSQNKTGSVSGSGTASVTVPAKSASTTYVPITATSRSAGAGSVSLNGGSVITLSGTNNNLPISATGYGTVSTGTGYITSGSTNSNSATQTKYISNLNLNSVYIEDEETWDAGLTINNTIDSIIDCNNISSSTYNLNIIDDESVSEAGEDSCSNINITVDRSSSNTFPAVCTTEVNSGSIINNRTYYNSSGGNDYITCRNSGETYIDIDTSNSNCTATRVSVKADSDGTKRVVTDGSWVQNTVTPSTSAQGPYYGKTTVSAVSTGSATTPATTKAQSTPSISVSDAGLITASVAATSVSVTPTVSAGWVSSGTAGTITMSASSNTKQLTTKAATTYNTSTSDQTIASGQYLTGTQTIKAVTHTATAAKVAAGQTVLIGDANDADRIASITGTFTSDATAAAANIFSGKTAYVNGSKITGTAAVSVSLNSGTDYTMVMPSGLVSIS